MLNRRTLLQGSGVLIATGVAGGPLAAEPQAGEDAELAALLQACAESVLTQSPEEATDLGFDVGANAALRSELNDRSLGALGRQLEQAKRALLRLARIDVSGLSPKGIREHAIAVFFYQTFADVRARYGFVDVNLRPSPYVVSQMNGAYYWLPDFIGSKHPLADPDDVAAWYARLGGLGAALDQETDRIRHDAAIGVAPPGFVLDETIAQITTLRRSPPRSTALMDAAIARAARAGLGDIGPKAEAIFRASLVPALSRQIQALQALRAAAVDTAGVWRLPDGDAYYASSLRANTTLETDAAALHADGLEQVAGLMAEIDLSLKAQGLSTGSVAARIDALNRDPRFLVSNDDAGREHLMSLARQELADVAARLPRAFNTPLVDPIMVRRVPVAVEAGAPAAFYEAGGAGQPGAFMLNLGRPSDFPVWRLPTLTHHEGVPGHHFQHGVARRNGAMPLFFRMLQFSAYTEGWALYAQQVADEIGVFEDDPFGRIGYLQSELFRAARIVVDTGLHHQRWTRDRAVAWMVEQIGETPEATRREVDRYCVYPGQALSFKAGANAIVAARESARRRLGSRFDVRTFHDLVLGSGPAPMAVLQAGIGQWR